MIFTMEEISSYLKVSKETLYKMIQRREIPCFKLGGQWRFKKDKIDAWLEELSNTPENTTPKNLDITEDDNGICEA